jgi:hypothetical protein
MAFKTNTEEIQISHSTHNGNMRCSPQKLNTRPSKFSFSIILVVTNGVKKKWIDVREILIDWWVLYFNVLRSSSSNIQTRVWVELVIKCFYITTQPMATPPSSSSISLRSSTQSFYLWFLIFKQLKFKFCVFLSQTLHCLNVNFAKKRVFRFVNDVEGMCWQEIKY